MRERRDRYEVPTDPSVLAASLEEWTALANDSLQYRSFNSADRCRIRRLHLLHDAVWADDGQKLDWLRELVDDLPEPFREAIELRFWGMLSERELAAELQVSRSTARYRVNKGLEMLKGELDGNELEA